MRCSKCGSENPNGVAFCGFCGSKLSSVCPRCGAPVQAGMTFCSNCGTKILSTTPQPSKTPNLKFQSEIVDTSGPSKGAKVMSIIFMILFFVSLIPLSYFFISFFEYNYYDYYSNYYYSYCSYSDELGLFYGIDYFEQVTASFCLTLAVLTIPSLILWLVFKKKYKKSLH